MKIEVKRLYKKQSYTVGKLYVDGKYICDTMEDVDRGLTQNMSEAEIKRRKVFGSTAIPTGEYNVSLAVKSPRFGKMPFYEETCGGRLPRLLRVPGYDGVLIHVGATAANTDGCILVGYNRERGRLVDGKDAFRKLMLAIGGANGVCIKIC